MTTYTYIHSFMTLSQRFDPNHDTCVTRLVWRRGLVVLAREYPCGPEVTAAAEVQPDLQPGKIKPAGRGPGWVVRGAALTEPRIVASGCRPGKGVGSGVWESAARSLPTPLAPAPPARAGRGLPAPTADPAPVEFIGTRGLSRLQTAYGTGPSFG